MITFELPQPPSGNHRNRWSRNGMYRSKQYLDYIRISGWLLKAVKRPQFASNAKLGIKVLVHPKNSRMVDLDNSVKALFDCIEMHLGILDEDYWHMELDRGAIHKPDGRCVITIWELEEYCEKSKIFI